MIGYRSPRKASPKTALIVIAVYVVVWALLSYGPGVVRGLGWL